MNIIKTIFKAMLFVIVANVQAQSAKVNKVWTEHGITQNGQKGMRIHANFSVAGMQGKQGRCNAWFYYGNEEQLLAAPHSTNAAPNGSLFVYASFTPNYANTNFTDFKLFLSYKELDDILTDKTELLFFIGIDDHNGYSLTDSEYSFFSYTPDTKARINNSNDNLLNSTTITSTGSKVTADEAQEALAFHNKARAEVGVAPLTWSEELSRYAQDWAEYLADNYNCEMHHRNELARKDKNYGENLYQASSSYGKIFTTLDASKGWYSEIKDFRNVGFNISHGTGHYSQMIWRNTTQVGFGVAQCAGGKYIIVANYNPAGNFKGQKAY